MAKDSHSAILELLRQATEGLLHVHATGLVHRDVKPQNILLTQRGTAVLGDFGISRDTCSSPTLTALPPGSAGWRAPEVLSQASGGSASSDVFSLGCVYAWALTRGVHPFGADALGRDHAIVRNAVNLAALEAASPPAADIVAQMLRPDPLARPSLAAVLQHMLFWPVERRLAFLHDASDVIEALDRAADPVLDTLEHNAAVVFGHAPSWGPPRIDAALWTDITRRRPYDPASVKDLLRAIRNKRSHFQELPADIRAILGPRPADLLRYFESRFPALLLHVQRFILTTRFRDDPRFLP
jgi:serine/threonine-protein kinase/endoribonuclease IRE1